MGNNHIMVDLETMGNRERSAIVSIGAVRFSMAGLEEEFYRVVDLESSVTAGLETDISTIVWWMQQGEEAKRIFMKGTPKTSLKAALTEFAYFIGMNAEVWGNGADFDNVILRNAYDAVGMSLPWKYWNNRCYRTFKGMFKEVKLVRSGTYHNALDDAKTQARHLIRIWHDKIKEI